MSAANGITTTVSVGKQGQSPRTIHDARCLEARQRLLVGAATDGVLPRAENPFPATKPEEVRGALAHHGKRG